MVGFASNTFDFHEHGGRVPVVTADDSPAARDHCGGKLLKAKVVAAVVLVWPVIVSAQTPAIQPQSPGLGSAATQPSPTVTMPSLSAQDNPFLGSTPAGQVTPDVLKLTLLGAIDRGLKYNLGLLLSSAQTDAARGARWRSLSEIVPNLNGRVGESFQQINTAQFGFRIPGLPSIIGPFAVFDSRATATEDFSLRGLHNFQASQESIHAAEHGVRNARELVVLAVGATYLQAMAAQARVQSAQAQLTTAQTLFRQATDMKSAGVVAGIDVLRAQVEMQAERQRLVFAQNEFAKSLLTLGRVIGLPAAQQYELSDTIPYQPLPEPTLEQALARALQSRSDYQALLAQVRAAELNKQAAEAEWLPSLNISADYGFLGNQPGGALGTYTVVGGIRIPIFQGGKVKGDVMQADSILRQRRAQAEDMRARIEYEVRTAALDVQAAGQEVEVAQQAQLLAADQLRQSQDRFAAGVAGNLEVVQAQQAVVTASENYINALNAHNVAKLLLSRAVGEAEVRVKEYLKGLP
jgi:outer membrane protein TolC